MDEARLAANRRGILERMARACERAGRDPADARLLAVTKAVGLAEIEALYALGQRAFGENRIPAGPEKAAALGEREGVDWHFVGHLQRNKARKALPVFRTIHSVESIELAGKLARRAEETGVAPSVFVEVNVAGEEQKYGVAPEAAEETVRALAALPPLRVAGLMTMAPYGAEPEAARPVFRRLRTLRDSIHEATGVALPELSMGMSGDFEVAVEEGATWVRVGSALFA